MTVLDKYIFEYTKKENNSEVTWTLINDPSTVKKSLLEGIYISSLKALHGNYLIFNGNDSKIKKSGVFYLNLNSPKEFQFFNLDFSCNYYLVTKENEIYGIKDSFIEKTNFCFSPH